ncbi:hypothetical protein J3R30DRAFT_3234737, partial [Lentinula aciculospora]
WETRWETNWSKAAAQHPRFPGAADVPNFKGKVLQRFQGLAKANSLVLTQACIGKIGLQGFLADRKVPGITSDCLIYGMAREDLCHIVAD